MATLLSKLSSKRVEVPSLPTSFLDWPEKQKGHPLQDLEVALPLEEAFDALFGRRAVVGEVCRNRQGSHDYAETEWLPSEAEAREAFTHISTAHKNGDSLASSFSQTAGETSRLGSLSRSIRAGYCRMNMSNSTHLGRIAYNIEREFCVAAIPGKAYEIHVCVASTAPMADRFRCIFKHELTRIDNSTTLWTGQYVMIFIEKTTFLLRKPIETGAQGAIKNNFQVLADALEKYAAERGSI